MQVLRHSTLRHGVPEGKGLALKLAGNGSDTSTGGDQIFDV